LYISIGFIWFYLAEDDSAEEAVTQPAFVASAALG
jgi:hypothetical protein